MTCWTPGKTTQNQHGTSNRSMNKETTTEKNQNHKGKCKKYHPFPHPLLGILFFAVFKTGAPCFPRIFPGRQAATKDMVVQKVTPSGGESVHKTSFHGDITLKGTSTAIWYPCHPSSYAHGAYRHIRFLLVDPGWQCTGERLGERLQMSGN